MLPPFSVVVGQLRILGILRSQEIPPGQPLMVQNPPGWPGPLPPPLTGGYRVALVLDELLDEAPVTWFRS